jgi:DNA-binding XRE family transcriptional regulator
MGTTLKNKMARLTPERRARIEAEADRLHAEYQTLKDLRKARDLTQAELAQNLGIRQATIAQLVKAQRSHDFHLARLRRGDGRAPSAHGRVPRQGAGLSRRLRRYRRAAPAASRTGAPDGHARTKPPGP